MLPVGTAILLLGCAIIGSFALLCSKFGILVFSGRLFDMRFFVYLFSLTHTRPHIWIFCIFLSTIPFFFLFPIFFPLSLSRVSIPSFSLTLCLVCSFSCLSFYFYYLLWNGVSGGFSYSQFLSLFFFWIFLTFFFFMLIANLPRLVLNMFVV